MNRKLIFLDIDGTLLPPGDMLIPESTLAGAGARQSKRAQAVLCTGRNHRMTAPLLEYGCFDGAHVQRGRLCAVRWQDCWWISPWSRSRQKAVRAALEQHGVDCTLEVP